MLMLMATTIGVAACTGVEDNAATPEQQRPADQQAVGFSAYVNRGTTRGGYQGTLDLTALQNAASGGFGVFAYYTNSYAYGQTSLPNFMYNQQVTWQTASAPASWTYSPVKYWPNETGTNGSYETDHLTFFAYAPYTEVDAVTGRSVNPSTHEIEKNPTGIAGLSRAADSGDPVVRYYASLKPAEAVDLCWNNTDHLNETKPNVNETVNFNFCHALSALNVQIDADVDEAAHNGTNDVDGNTRIYVRSITFNGFAEKGQLNLNNTSTTPRWNNLDCDCDLSSEPITIYDGRRDGREGVAASLNELHTGLNPIIVQSGPYSTVSSFTSTTAGVTNTAVNLFDVTGMSGNDEAKLAAPIYVIPTNEPLYVTIVYDVETYDPKLTSQYLSDGRTHGSTIENTISAAIKNGSNENITMEAGKQYTISLHLGVTSVTVNATVSDWKDGDTIVVPLPE